MSKATHTPGPWAITGQSGDGKAIFVRADGDGWARLACEVDSDDCDSGVAMANAHLIAAAPDLLSACHGGPGARNDAFASNLMTFADWLEGKLEPHFRSQLNPSLMASVLRSYAETLQAAIAAAVPTDGGRP